MALKTSVPSAHECRSVQMYRWRSSLTFLIVTVSMAIFTESFIYSAVVPFIPTLLRVDCHVAPKDIQKETSLIITAYGVLDFFGAPICSLYIDSTSNRRIPFLGGIIFMASGTTLFGIGRAQWLLFLGRVLQGFGSALLYTVSLALLADAVPREDVGKWLGTVLSFTNIGDVISPLFGGVIYHSAGRYAVFGTMMALITVDATFRILLVEKPKQKQHNPTKLPSTTQENMAIGLDDVEDSAINGPENKPHVSQTLKVLPSMESKIRINRFASIRLLIKSPRLLVALYGIFLNSCVSTSLMAVMPIFVNRTFNWNTLGAGLIFLTIAIPSSGGFLAGWLSDRFGPKIVATSGLLICGPTIMFLRFVQHDSLQQKVLLCALLTIIGIGTSLFISSLSADLSFVADEESQTQKALAGVIDDGVTDMSLYAASFSLLNSAMAAATLFGPLFMGWLNQSHGWGTMTAVLGSVVLSGVIPCILFTGGKAL